MLVDAKALMIVVEFEQVCSSLLEPNLNVVDVERTIYSCRLLLNLDVTIKFHLDHRDIYWQLLC